jgi:fatty acid desaturase
VNLRNVFGPDVRRAINATQFRKLVSFGSMILLVALAVAFGNIAPWWVWLLLLICEGVVFIVLGNHWASKDALKKFQQDH